MALCEPRTAARVLSETFFRAVQRDDYKEGAFKDLITADTPPLTAIDIFLQSPVVSNHEKRQFRKVRTALINGLEGRWNNPTDARFLLDIMAIGFICNVFEVDMRRRGLCVRPIMIQKVNPATGRVASTTTIDSSGIVRRITGGRRGVVPDGTPGFELVTIGRSTTYAKLKTANFARREQQKRQHAATRGTNDNGTLGVKNKLGKEDLEGIEEAMASLSTKDEEGSKFGLFGKVFEKNLRGALL
ncbi:hypothetical protein VTO42DRAFT_8383 [Malbranchea cinnamomea]